MFRHGHRVAGKAQNLVCFSTPGGLEGMTTFSARHRAF